MFYTYVLKTTLRLKCVLRFSYKKTLNAEGGKEGIFASSLARPYWAPYFSQLTRFYETNVFKMKTRISF